ncbi:MAG: hypothetical protein K9M45_10335 [Kiritimatiellales bacterium]|nr:hypothetical protein [Kiritimatiellales bacterium]
MKQLIGLLLLCLLAQAGATEIEIVNSSAEINNGVDGTAISDPSVLGWGAVDGTIQAGGTDYGNGAWRLNYEDGGAVFQMTSHAISTGESFSLRFDAAGFTEFGDDVFFPNLTLIAGSTLNGDFNANTDTNDSHSFALTPEWTNVGTGNQTVQATRINKDFDGTRNAVLYNGSNKVFQ